MVSPADSQQKFKNPSPSQRPLEFVDGWPHYIFHSYTRYFLRFGSLFYRVQTRFTLARKGLMDFWFGVGYA